MNSDEGGRGAGDEDTELIESLVCWVSVADGFEGHFG